MCSSNLRPPIYFFRNKPIVTVTQNSKLLMFIRTINFVMFIQIMFINNSKDCICYVTKWHQIEKWKKRTGKIRSYASKIGHMTFERRCKNDRSSQTKNNLIDSGQFWAYKGQIRRNFNFWFSSLNAVFRWKHKNYICSNFSERIISLFSIFSYLRNQSWLVVPYL